MKNAVFPSIIFIIMTTALFWFEYESFARTPKVYLVSVASLEQENYEIDGDSKKSALNTTHEQSHHDEQFNWVINYQLAKKLINSQRYSDLAPKDKLKAKLALAKHLLPKKPGQSVELIESLSEDERYRFQANFTLAMAHSKLGAYEKAIRIYSLLLEQDPNHQAGAINLALLYKKHHNYVSALQVLKHAINISNGKKRAKALSIQAYCLAKLGEYRNALDSYRRSIEYRPEHAGTWLGLAKMQKNLDKPFADVQKTFSRAIRLNSNHYKPLAQYGRYQLEKLDFTGAIKSLARATKLAPFQTKIRRNLAWALYENEQFPRSRQQWQWLAKNEKNQYRRKFANFAVDWIDGDQSRIYSNRIAIEKIIDGGTLSDELEMDYEYLLLLTSLNEEASDSGAYPTIGSADSLALNSNRIKWQQAKWHLERQQDQLAEVALQQLKNGNLSTSVIDFKLSQLYSSQKKEQLALKYVDLALIGKPGSRKYRIHKARTELALNRPEEAARSLEKLRESSVNSSEMTALLAEIAWQKKNWIEAREAYQKFLTLEKEDDIALYRIAVIAHKLGNIKTAKSELARALAINSELIPARALLAKILCQEGQKDRCVDEAHKVLKLDNSHPQARYLINI